MKEPAFVLGVDRLDADRFLVRGSAADGRRLFAIDLAGAPDANLSCQTAARSADEWPDGPGEGAKRPEATNGRAGATRKG